MQILCGFRQNWNEHKNAYFAHFLDGHRSLLHSRLAKESWIFRKPFKIIVSSTLKNMSQLYGGMGLSPFDRKNYICTKVFKLGMWKKNILKLIKFKL